MIAFNEIDIMSLNETHLNSSHVITIPNYNIIRLDRQRRWGGGVCLIVRDTIDFNQIHLDELNEEEAIILEFPTISTDHDRLIIMSYYSPPDKLINKHLIEKLFKLSENTLIIGDLNAHHEQWFSNKPNKKGKIITDLMNSLDLVLLNTNEPTYLPPNNTKYSAIRIDLIISTEALSEKTRNFRTPDLLHSDHVSLLIELKHINSLVTKNKKEIKITRIDQEKLHEELVKNSPKPEDLKTPGHIEELCKTLTNAISISS